MVAIAGRHTPWVETNLFLTKLSTNLFLHLHSLRVSLPMCIQVPQREKKKIKNKYIYIREYGSTLYVGFARAVSPTNTNFRLTFLLTRLQEALYEDLAV